MARIDIRSNGGGGSVAEGVLQLQGGVAMSSTLTAVADQNDTTSPLKLSTTAVQVTSPLRITTSDASGFYLDCEDGSGDNRFSIKRLPAAQEVSLDFASNPVQTDALVGSIRTYRDGVSLSETMSFLKDGKVGIGTTTPLGILHLKVAAGTTRMVMDGDAGQSKIITYRTAGLQRFGLYTNNTAESGSNVGSDFAIRAYSDAGTLLNTPVFIKRSTGNVGINTITGTAKLQVVGSGSTSATTSLLVQNGAGTPLDSLRIQDNFQATFGNANSKKIILNPQGIGVYGDSSLITQGSSFSIESSSTSNLSEIKDQVLILLASGSSDKLQIGSGGISATLANGDFSINSTTFGFKPPRMTNAQRLLITTPSVGLMVYCTDVVEGLYVYKSTGWTFVI
jgi:hypothetical protein